MPAKMCFNIDILPLQFYSTGIVAEIPFLYLSLYIYFLLYSLQIVVGKTLLLPSVPQVVFPFSLDILLESFLSHKKHVELGSKGKEQGFGAGAARSRHFSLAPVPVLAPALAPASILAS